MVAPKPMTPIRVSPGSTLDIRRLQCVVDDDIEHSAVVKKLRKQIEEMSILMGEMAAENADLKKTVEQMARTLTAEKRADTAKVKDTVGTFGSFRSLPTGESPSVGSLDFMTATELDSSISYTTLPDLEVSFKSKISNLLFATTPEQDLRPIHFMQREPSGVLECHEDVDISMAYVPSLLKPTDLLAESDRRSDHSEQTAKEDRDSWLEARNSTDFEVVTGSMEEEGNIQGRLLARAVENHDPKGSWGMKELSRSFSDLLT